VSVGQWQSAENQQYCWLKTLIWTAEYAHSK
jgi:hypothetical protein